MQPLRSAGRSNFDKGRHNLTTLIQKSTYINESCYIVYIYIYICMYIIYFMIILSYMHILVKVSIKVISFKSSLLAQFTIMHNYLKQLNIDPMIISSKTLKKIGTFQKTTQR